MEEWSDGVIRFNAPIQVNMRIRLNGEEYTTGDIKSLEDLLKEINVHSERVAVEVNLKIISKSDYRTYILKDGDTVEVVSFVGGGY